MAHDSQKVFALMKAARSLFNNDIVNALTFIDIMTLVYRWNTANFDVFTVFSEILKVLLLSEVGCEVMLI